MAKIARDFGRDPLCVPSGSARTCCKKTSSPVTLFLNANYLHYGTTKRITMSTDIVDRPPAPVQDEKDAIMSLLGLHSSAREERGNSKVAIKANCDLPVESEESSDDEDDDGNDDKDEDEEETGVASPVLKRSYDGIDNDEDDSSSVEDESRPQTISPYPETSTGAGSHSTMGIPLRRIGKKRKHHPSVDGQFEDAHENLFPSFPSVVNTLPKYSEHSMPPPPPHLIQQTSNEFASHAQTSAELTRQALAFQQRSIMAETSGLYPSPRIAAMMAGPTLSGPTMGEMYDRRFHVEAMMALQAKMHFARQAGAQAMPTIPGMPGHMAAFGSSSLSRINGSLGVHTRPNNNADTTTAYDSDDDDPKTLGSAMRPPSSPTANRVESEEEEDDPYKKKGLQPDSTKKGKNAIPFSTKERYERYTPPPSWGKLTKVPKMPAVKADNKVNNPITEIKDNDVLLGRGGLTNTNPGNIKFRKLVSKYRVHYCTAPKGDKGALARYLCNYVRAMHGRFLAKASDGPAWYEVGDEKAVSKCGQALREGTAEFNRKETESFGTTI